MLSAWTRHGELRGTVEDHTSSVSLSFMRGGFFLSAIGVLSMLLGLLLAIFFACATYFLHARFFLFDEDFGVAAVE